MKHLISETAGALQSILQQTHRQFDDLAALPTAALTQRPEDGGWNALECLEHLNRYADFYLPAITARLGKAPVAETDVYHSGWLGGKFAQSMQAEKARRGKMKSPASKNPSGAALDAGEVLKKFRQNLASIQAILQQSRGLNWSAVRIPTSLSPLLRLNLGDTLRFYIHHTDRHMQQALRAVRSSQ